MLHFTKMSDDIWNNNINNNNSILPIYTFVLKFFKRIFNNIATTKITPRMEQTKDVALLTKDSSKI